MLKAIGKMVDRLKGVSNGNIREEFFIPAENQKKRKKLFKDNVKNFHMEISSYCNRKCPYCPVAYFDKEKNRNMDPALIDKMLGELKEINYSKTFLFHYYNEPLYDYDYFLSVYHKVREALPQARLKLYSNGDYFTKEMLSELKSGINSFNFTMHYADQWDEDVAQKAIEKFYKRLDVTPDIFKKKETEFVSKCKLDNCVLNVNAVNFSLSGQDRGDLVDGDIITKAPRVTSCSLPKVQFNVDFEGNVFPCCNLFPRSDSMREYNMGNVAKDTVWDIYCSEGYSRFRHLLTTLPIITENLPEVCRECTDER